MVHLNKIQVPFIITAMWFALVTINVNQTLGLIYLVIFTIFPAMIYRWDKARNIPLSKNGRWLISGVQGILIYVGFVLIASVLLPLFEKINVGKLLQLIATTTPALAESKILNTITFVAFVPFAETITFIILLDYLASKWNINITKNSLFKLKTISLILGLAFLFLLFHVTTKGITNNVALLLVFLMMVVTLVGAIWFGEAKQVIFFHVIANAFGLGLLGIFTGVISLMIIPVIIIPLAILIIPKFNIQLNKNNKTNKNG